MFFDWLAQHATETERAQCWHELKCAATGTATDTTTLATWLQRFAQTHEQSAKTIKAVIGATQHVKQHE